jgi:Sec-independent protein secretion pathway component TatC
MGGPMYILYEICIGIAWLMRDKENQATSTN